MFVGNGRFWIPDRDMQPDPAPEWLYQWARGELDEWLAAQGFPRAGGPVTYADGDGDLPPIREGSRNNSLTSMAGVMRERGFSEAAMRAALLATNEERCDPPLDVEDVCTIARSVARYTPNPLADVTIVRGTGEAGLKELPAEPLKRIPASQLRRLGDAEKWLLRGLIPAEMVTIFSALPKAGKTTLL